MGDQAAATLNPGTRVTWLYGNRLVPGVVVRVGPKRAQIRVASRIHDGSWYRSHRWVERQNLLPREHYVDSVDDPEEAAV